MFRVPLFHSLYVAALCGCYTTASLAMSFTEALELALKRDPTFLSARASYQASQERASIAVSTLLPQLSISGNTALNDRKYVTQGILETTDIQKFTSDSAQINLTQGLWRHAERIASTQADLAALQGENQVVAAKHDLLVRFLQAWFDVMSARNDIKYAAEQSAAASKLWVQTSRAFGLELASEAELEDALARYENAKAEQAAAEADMEVKIAAFEQIIGPVEVFTPPSLSENLPAIIFTDEPLSHWLELTESANPAVIAATYGVRAASEEIRKQRAGHEPTIDITGSYGRMAQGVGTTPTQQAYTNTQGTIGLQLNIPIYSGGGQSAKVREAIALREKASQDLENARRSVRSAAKQAWFGIQSGVARYKAATQAVKSASANLRVATSGKKRDLKTELDVLRANQQLYGALRDLHNAQYEIVLNKIKLKAAAGRLAVGDVIALDTAFIQPAPGSESLTDLSPQARQTSPVALVRKLD